MRCGILKNVNKKFKKVWIFIAEGISDHIFAYYDSLLPIDSDEIIKDFKYGWIIPNGDIKKGKNSHLFGEITIKAIPPIYIWHPKNLKKTSILNG